MLKTCIFMVFKQYINSQETKDCYGNIGTVFYIRKFIVGISVLQKLCLLEVVFWVTMVDARSMKQISFIGNMQIQYFSITVYGIGNFSSKRRSNLNYFRLNPNK